jgi:hypothetical protein
MTSNLLATWTRNETCLEKHGFVRSARYGVMELVHPKYPTLVLLSSQLVPNRLDLFTEYDRYPMNVEGDPRNICIGIPEHDPAFVEAIMDATVKHFLNLTF